MQPSSFKHQAIGFLLLLTVLFGNISTFAQTKAAAPGQSKTKTCNGAWSGTVSYTETWKNTWTGRYGSFHNETKITQANFPIRDDGTAIGSFYAQGSGIYGSFTFKSQASGSRDWTVNQLQVSEKDDYCKLSIAGANGKTRVRCSTKNDRSEQLSGSGEGEVGIYFNGKTFKIGISSPKIGGKYTQSGNSSCTGTCSKDTPINHTDNSVIQPSKLVSYETDDIPFNPDNPGRLSGTFSKTDSDGKTVTTVKYNLAQCAPPVRVDAIAFEQHQVPDAKSWHGVDSLTGATDGNLVKIKATVFNGGGETVYPSVKFSETTSGEALPNGTVSTSIKPGEARDVEYEWDTSGYSWDENQTAKAQREIKVEVDGDMKTEKIKILPKPVVLVHGLWSNAAAWAEWHGYLREAHSFAWDAFPVGEDPNNGKMNTGDHALNYDPTNSVFQNAQELAKQIKWVREQKNAWHIDVVAHSMGGLISRFYIHNLMQPVFDGKPELRHLVMLGTPNQGSACADLMYWTYNEVGDKPVEALRQLKPSVVAEMNKNVYNRKGVKFSILGGYGVPATCGLEIGDGVVPLSSALYNISDRGYTVNHHLALTDEQYFKSFVMPRIALGPKKAQSEETTAWLENLKDDNYTLAARENEENDRDGDAKYFRPAAYRPAETGQTDGTTDEAKNATMRQAVKSGPKQTKEIDIPVRDGSSAGVVLIALPGVAATLTDASGAVVGISPVQAFRNYEYFRTIAAMRPVTGGTWKLKLENASNEETLVLVAGFTNSGAASDFTVTAGKPTAAGTVGLTAKWMENNALVLNARITAKIAGQSAAVEFFDDGKHADGVAGDGVYGATTEKLVKGEYYIEAKAEANNQTKIAIANFNTGVEKSAPAKPAAVKKRR